MHVYKFRLLSDIHEDFVREIELLGNQTFKDFHGFISESTAINNIDLASFYICNQKWQKQKEITLVDMTAGEDLFDDEDRREDKVSNQVFLMEDEKIRSSIEDPHQHILYEYDSLDLKTLQIELIGIWKNTKDQAFPVCTLSEGSLKPKPRPKTIEEEEAELDELNDDMIEDIKDTLDDTFVYKGDGDSLLL